MKMCALCGDQLPNFLIINGERKNIQNRKYCVKCSPFGNHNTKKLHSPPDYTNRVCSKCGESNLDNFYGKKRYNCKKCHNKYTLDKGKEKREFLIELLGGKCVVCGYDKHMCGFDVHHIDPSKKDMKFSSHRGWTIDRIKKEADGCVLLCKVCHAIEHYNLNNGLGTLII